MAISVQFWLAVNNRVIDRELRPDFYIGDAVSNIKIMDYSSLAGYKATLKNKHIVGALYWQKGVLGLLRRDEYQTYLMTGELTCLSTWLFLILKTVFHPKKRAFFWTHGWYGHENGIKKVLKKFFFKMADGAFLYGNYAKEGMIENGFEAEKLFVIHNSLSYDQQLRLRNSLVPTDIYKSYFGNDFPVLLFIGRLTEVKRLDMVLDAMVRLREKGENYNMVFVGDGVKRSDLEKQADEQGLNDSVWFYGACYDERTNAELIYNADVCVAPGNVGLTAMHTMVFGCPVITHNDFKWQMPEFEAIHAGKTGDFFERGSVGSLADAVSAWFSHKRDKREEVREACYKEIDTQWTPEFQVNVLKQGLGL